MKKTQKKISYMLVDYQLKSLTDLLMSRYGVSFDDAMFIVMASETYKKIAVTGILQDQSPLYVFSILEKELKEAGILK